MRFIKKRFSLLTKNIKKKKLNRWAIKKIIEIIMIELCEWKKVN
jgi:hypothetical protein